MCGSSRIADLCGTDINVAAGAASRARETVFLHDGRAFYARLRQNEYVLGVPDRYPLLMQNYGRMRDLSDLDRIYYALPSAYEITATPWYIKELYLTNGFAGLPLPSQDDLYWRLLNKSESVNSHTWHFEQLNAPEGEKRLQKDIRIFTEADRVIRAEVHMHSANKNTTRKDVISKAYFMYTCGGWQKVGAFQSSVLIPTLALHPL